MRPNFLLKSVLVKVLPNSFALRYLSRLPQFHAWLQEYVGAQCPKFSLREDLYAYIYDTHIRDTRLEYFEMGVWYGAAIKSWTQLDSNEDSRYFGFDTFEGLPEVWEGLTANAKIGTFNVGGDIDNVNINDRRVTLIKGLFQDTVHGFLESTDFSESAMRVLHIDSDLYTSALFCLSKFDHILRKNDLVIFDELSSMDEFWALIDYSTAFRRDYKVLGHAGEYYQCVAIQML
jgi:hypothetical protein